MSVRILPARDIQVLAAFALSHGILDHASEGMFVDDIRDANRRLFEMTYGLTAHLEATEELPPVVRRPAGEAAAAFALVIYNAGNVANETGATLVRIGEAIMAEYASEKTRLH